MKLSNYKYDNCEVHGYTEFTPIGAFHTGDIEIDFEGKEYGYKE